MDDLSRAIGEPLRMWPGKTVDRKYFAISWWLYRVIIHHGPVGNHEDAVGVGSSSIIPGIDNECSIQLPVLCTTLYRGFGAVPTGPIEVGPRSTGQEFDFATLSRRNNQDFFRVSRTDIQPMDCQWLLHVVRDRGIDLRPLGYAQQRPRRCEPSAFFTEGCDPQSRSVVLFWRPLAHRS